MKIIIEDERSSGKKNRASIDVGEFSPFKAILEDWVCVCEFNVFDNPASSDPNYFVGNIYYSKKNGIWWFVQYFKGRLHRAKVNCIEPLVNFISKAAYDDFKEHVSNLHCRLTNPVWKYNCFRVGTKKYTICKDVHNVYYAVNVDHNFLLENIAIVPVYIGKPSNLKPDIKQIRYVVRNYCLK